MSHIHFTKDLVGIKDSEAFVLHGTLSDKPVTCCHCGCNNPKTIKYGFRKVTVRLLSSNAQPVILKLRKQRYLCKEYGSIIFSKTNLVDKCSTISRKHNCFK